MDTRTGHSILVAVVTLITTISMLLYFPVNKAKGCNGSNNYSIELRVQFQWKYLYFRIIASQISPSSCNFWALDVWLYISSCKNAHCAQFIKKSKMFCISDPSLLFPKSLHYLKLLSMILLPINTHPLNDNSTFTITFWDHLVCQILIQVTCAKLNLYFSSFLIKMSGSTKIDALQNTSTLHKHHYQSNL